MVAKTRRCSKCGELKGLEEFHQDPDGRDGRAVACSTCEIARVKAFKSSERGAEYRRRQAEAARVRRANARRKLAARLSDDELREYVRGEVRAQRERGPGWRGGTMSAAWFRLRNEGLACEITRFRRMWVEEGGLVRGYRRD